MNQIYFAAIGLFVASLIGSRLLQRQSVKDLEVEKSRPLLLLAAKLRVVQSLPILIALIVFFFLAEQMAELKSLITSVFFALLIIYLTGINFYFKKKLDAMELPDRFRKFAMASVLVHSLGFTGSIILISIAGKIQ